MGANRGLSLHTPPVRIANLLQAAVAAGRPTYSLEFFPPKTEAGLAQLWRSVDTFMAGPLDFISVTYGAGGSTQSLSQQVTAEMIQRTGLPVLAHVTCVGATASDLATIVDGFAAAGVTDFLALRGDPPTGAGTQWRTTPGGYTYASELVAALSLREEFSIGVAAFPEGHPESQNLADDAKVLAQKQQAGADYAITNLFFNANDYFAMVKDAATAGCNFPILPGLMPVTNLKQIERITALSGATLPVELAAEFAARADDEVAVRELGIETTTKLALQLLEGGAPGIHLYPLNQATSAQAVLERLVQAGWR